MLAYQIISSAHSVVEFTRLMSQIGKLDEAYSPQEVILLKEAI